MTKIADIYVNIPTKSINKPFSYVVPENMHIAPGWRVVVPFGSRKVEGFVVAIREAAEEGLKQIESLLDDIPWFDENMFKTAVWISNYYLCTLSEAMRLFIPGKSGIKVEIEYTPVLPMEPLDNSTLNSELFLYLRKKGQATEKELLKHFGKQALHELIGLQRSGYITKISSVKRKVAPKLFKYLRLKISEEEAVLLNSKLTGKPAQQRLLQRLLQNAEIPLADLKKNKIAYSTIHKLVDIGAAVVDARQTYRNSYLNIDRVEIPKELSSEQNNVCNTIFPYIQRKTFASFLLHGVTGSGKTQIYIEVVEKVLRQGRQAIVMVPEIALTGQIVARFKAKFGNAVVVLHSKLSLGEREDALIRLKRGEAGIVIGARSAIFAPVPNLGAIIMDEEHEFTYKQEEAPRYHAKNISLIRAQLAQAVVILGSATPSVETYFEAKEKQHILLELPQRIDGSELPEVTVVDMREELKLGRKSVVSGSLQQLLADTLKRGEQAVILLNRRGYSTFVMCRECGYVLRCSHCDVSLVYHQSSKSLKCHYCQAQHSVPDICPSCNSRYIKYFGTGTQKVEEELYNLFPQAKIVRMDQDTTMGKYSHQKILSAFKKKEYDILLGTQMVAKGHDIPNVTAVGIISADTALNLPDFRAAERTFSLLTQAAGRAGRGTKSGKVVVQTYNPEHYAIIAGMSHNYKQFYEQELLCRKPLGYPPFAKMIKLTIRHNDEIFARRQAEKIVDDIRLKTKNICQIMGPFVSPVAKVNDIYRVNIVLKTEKLQELIEMLRNFEYHYNPDLVIDVEPLNVL